MPGSAFGTGGEDILEYHIVIQWKSLKSSLGLKSLLINYSINIGKIHQK